MYGRIASSSGSIVVWIVMLGMLLVSPVGAAEQSGSIPDKAYQWLVRQQASTGILGNQESETFSGLYANAVAAMCFIHQGDVDLARRMFTFFESHREREFASDTPGGFPQFADAGTGQMLRDADRWIGDNSWLLMALNYYVSKTGDKQFDPMREQLAKWIISLQDPNGGVKAGFNKAGPMLHYSTEGNLDVYAALVNYPKARAKVRTFLLTDMWVEEEKRFKMGSTVNEPALDTCAWAIAALGPELATTLPHAQRTFLTTNKSDVTGLEVTAFRDLLGKERIWLEGTGEMIVAYNVAGQKELARKYLDEMNKAMIPSKQWPGLVGLPCATSDPPWETGSTLIFVPSQAWYLFGAWDFNPMAGFGD
ncbi:MAG TPA: hypothetical protein DCM28_03025 [Phycisphaerales bacterium]|nr:hypothetical protein [Phycisphaerales bacterium]HCD34001.1 hypothetical protein [Phycisphaerales bacterium]